MTPKAPAPYPPLVEAQAEHDALAADLTRFSEALEERERELQRARRAGGKSKDLAALGSEVASLREIVAAQEADVADAHERLVAARFAAQRAEQLERNRAAATELDKLRDQIAQDLRALAPAVAAPVARIATAAARWRELFDAYADSVAQLDAIAATEAGTEPTDPAHVLADPAAWQRASAALEAAGVDPAAFRDHPSGNGWQRARGWNGPTPAYAPQTFTVSMPDLVAPLTVDPQHPAAAAWGVLDAPDLAREVAAAVLDGTLDAKAKPTNASTPA